MIKYLASADALGAYSSSEKTTQGGPGHLQNMPSKDVRVRDDRQTDIYLRPPLANYLGDRRCPTAFLTQVNLRSWSNPTSSTRTAATEMSHTD